MPSRRKSAPGRISQSGVSRRQFLTVASAGVMGVGTTGSAWADSLADVPARGPGAPLGSHSERSQYVHLDRIPEAGPGLRNVDPGVAINSKTPLDKLVDRVPVSGVRAGR
jgi:sulfane dehydrogenase subunit SoxC